MRTILIRVIIVVALRGIKFIKIYSAVCFLKRNHGVVYIKAVSMIFFSACMFFSLTSFSSSNEFHVDKNSDVLKAGYMKQ